MLTQTCVCSCGHLHTRIIVSPSGQRRLSLPCEVARNTETMKVIEQVSARENIRVETKAKALEGRDSDMSHTLIFP